VKRRLFNLLAAVSTALAVATAILWASSYGKTGWVSAWGPTCAFNVLSANGRFIVQRVERGDDPHRQHWSLGHGIVGTRVFTPAQYGGDFYSTVGLISVMGDVPTQTDATDQVLISVRQAPLRQVLIPYWLLLMLLLLLPLRGAIRLAHAQVAARRRREGRCEVCGYDLRASKDRCPECGTAIPAAGGRAI